MNTTVSSMDTPESLRRQYNIPEISEKFSIDEEQVITWLLTPETLTSNPLMLDGRERVRTALEISPQHPFERMVIEHIYARRQEPDYDSEIMAIAIRILAPRRFKLVSAPAAST